jgi:hypothetical protein
MKKRGDNDICGGKQPAVAWDMMGLELARFD